MDSTGLIYAGRPFNKANRGDTISIYNHFPRSSSFNDGYKDAERGRRDHNRYDPFDGEDKQEYARGFDAQERDERREREERLERHEEQEQEERKRFNYERQRKESEAEYYEYKMQQEQQDEAEEEQKNEC